MEVRRNTRECRSRSSHRCQSSRHKSRSGLCLGLCELEVSFRAQSLASWAGKKDLKCPRLRLISLRNYKTGL